MGFITDFYNVIAENGLCFTETSALGVSNVEYAFKTILGGKFPIARP